MSQIGLYHLSTHCYISTVSEMGQLFLGAEQYVPDATSQMSQPLLNTG